ncbi:MAG: ABC transporter substrate-binding protein, partial [Thermodesulfobacteriota bacterium]
MKQIQYLAIALWFSFLGTVQAAEFPLTFTDSAGDETTLTARPQRVVSLVPSVTEMLMRIGAAESVVGITHHSLVPYQAGDKTVVGGFLKPDPSRVASLQPDLIFYSDLQSEVIDSFQDETLLIQLSPGSIEESFRQLQLLGKIFAREEQSAEIIKEQRRQLKVIAEKVEKIPQEERLRVMRFMDRQQLLTPGDDSFQNEYIRAAGAIAPSFGKNGNIIGVTPEQLKGFNPQLLYGCGNKKGISPREFAAWGEIDATRKGRVSFFPCDLTCRASTHQGDFVSRLAATIYREQFAREQDFVLPEQVVKRSPLAMDLDYVKKAEILESDIKDFRNKTVAITFHQAMKVVSTLEGERDSITTVANHYFPPPSWGLGHGGGLATLEEETRKVLGF